LIKNDTYKLPLRNEIPIGIEHKSFNRLSEEYDIDLNKFFIHLKKYNIKANRNITFKRLAKKNNLHPAQLYYLLIASQLY